MIGPVITLDIRSLGILKCGLAGGLLGLLMHLLSACSGGPGQGAVAARLSVLAASSLTEAFEALAERFEARHPGLDVLLTFAGSQALRTQLQHGARADLFASANPGHVRALARTGLVTRLTPFASGELAVIVPSANPAGITRFDQLPAARRIIVGQPAVPIGQYTHSLWQRAQAVHGQSFVERVRARIVSQESSARMLSAKVALGEADAAIVYRSDARATRGVRSVTVPDGLNVRAQYVLGEVATGASPAWARRFVAFVLAEEGQSTLQRFGFGVRR